MKDLIMLKPHFTHNIWGGTKLKTDFGYDKYNIEGNDIGECWGISGHPDGESTLIDSEYGEITLSKLWNDNPEVFGRDITSSQKEFPLLVKILDAKDDLSIQVHPDDEYARANENGSLGKMECWYILDCEENSTLVVGHNAKDKADLEDMIRNSRWTDFISEIPVKKGDFIQINPGTVHAIKGGIVLLETQQSSNITYRVYDYDRLQNGKPRELHIEKSIDVITAPAEEPSKCVKVTAGDALNEASLLYKCKYYSVYHMKADGTTTVNVNKNAPYMLLTVVNGEGTINGTPVVKGDHMIVTANAAGLSIGGAIEIIYSHE